jgi:hypothetical protein
MIDTQLIELAGRNPLIESVLAAGLDVALPIRDDGADLVAYRRKGDGLFMARPVQFKTSTLPRFVDRNEYEVRESLIMAYVWGQGSDHDLSTVLQSGHSGNRSRDALGRDRFLEERRTTQEAGLVLLPKPETTWAA